MTFTLTFKTPDISDQVDGISGCFPDDVDSINAVVAKFVEYGEYITVEFDTDEKTARVMS